MALLLQLITSTVAYGCYQTENGIAYPAINSYTDWEVEPYLDDAEIALVRGDFAKAEIEFSAVINLCRNSSDREKRMFRALFGRILSTASLNMQEECLEDINALNRLIDSLQCHEIQQKNTNSQGDEEYLANGKPILGPDEISKEKCLELVKNTIDYSEKILLVTNVNTKWKAVVLAALELSAEKAKQCCLSGGIWKACIQPLFSKWLELKEWENECRRVGKWYYLPPLD